MNQQTVVTTKPVIENTPWEHYTLDDVPIYVKREDLCCPAPGPSFSKIRGVYRHLKAIKQKRGVIPIGVMDTVHSKAGWGVAYICQALGLPCYDFFPVLKKEWVRFHLEYTIRPNQVMAESLGAYLAATPAGMSAVLYNRAKSEMKNMFGQDCYMMPNALKLEESISETAFELGAYTPDEILHAEGTWLVSVSSGTIAAGVIRGLVKCNVAPIVIAHMGYNRDEDRLMEYMLNASGTHYPFLQIVNEGYDYKQAVEAECPFPCNPFYDLKAWKWLMEHYQELQPPIIFWNIGA